MLTGLAGSASADGGAHPRIYGGRCAHVRLSFTSCFSGTLAEVWGKDVYQGLDPSRGLFPASGRFSVSFPKVSGKKKKVFACFFAIKATDGSDNCLRSPPAGQKSQKNAFLEIPPEGLGWVRVYGRWGATQCGDVPNLRR